MKKEDKTVLITGGITALAESEVLKYVPSEEYARIKAEDPHPMFIMATVGYEGEANGQLWEGDLESGKRLSNWYKQLWPLKAVKALTAMMKRSTYPIYTEHQTGQEVNQRVSVGTIINATKRVINNVTHSVAIAYINNYRVRKAIENGELDSASIEATCTFRESAANMFHYIVEDVKEFFGIALCKQEQAGFQDASILAVVTAMAEGHDHDNEEGSEGDKDMKISEVKEWIREHGIQPVALFAVEDLTKVAEVKAAFETDFEEQTKKKDETIKTLTDELAPFKKQAAQSKVSDMVRGSELLKDAEKNVVDYLASTINVDVTDCDKPQEAVDKAIKAQMDLINSTKLAEIKTKATDKAGSKGGAGKSDEETDETDENDEKDMTIPANNELIPQVAASEKKA